MTSTDSTPKKRRAFSAWSKDFIALLREYGVVTYAAEGAGVDRSTAYKAKERNGRFSELWNEAIEEATDRLELEARRRAESGVQRLKFYQGEPVMIPLLDESGNPTYRDRLDDSGQPFKNPDGTIKQEMVFVPYVEQEYSDTLMIFLLKAHRPEKFRERFEHSGPGGQPIPIAYIKENRDNGDAD